MPFAMAIFDLDGTLVDSLPDIAGALNQTLAEVGLPPLPRAQVALYVGDGATRLVERALEGTGRPLADAVARFRKHYAQHLYTETRPYPGIEPLLRHLSSAMPLAVLTNKPAELARPLLAALGLDRYFADVLADGDGFPRKPAPEAGHWLLSRHNVDAEQTLVIGDGLPDIHFARALGAPMAAVTWGYVARELLSPEHPTWMVDEPPQLLPIALSQVRSESVRPG
jgi:phosphoglycolate phosphatase